MKKVIAKVGDMGWSDGSAFKVLQFFPSAYGTVYLCEMVNLTAKGIDPRKYRKLGKNWQWAFTQKEMNTCDLHQDCNGEKPKRAWFRKK